MKVKFYTGFATYALLLGFAVNNLTYWDTEKKEERQKMKINSFTQLFLTLVKLRLNLREIQTRHPKHHKIYPFLSEQKAIL